MNLDKIVSKKMSIAIVTLIMLQQSNAPTMYIAMVGIAAIVCQCVLDYKEKTNEKVDDLAEPRNPSDL